jgi:hypothetical protein
MRNLFRYLTLSVALLGAPACRSRCLVRRRSFMRRPMFP